MMVVEGKRKVNRKNSSFSQLISFSGRHPSDVDSECRPVTQKHKFSPTD